MIADGCPGSLRRKSGVNSEECKELQRNLPPQLRGWTLDVLRVVRQLGATSFSLADVYEVVRSAS